jgi:hypothetical protein
MTQTCQNCKKEFQIAEEDLQFYERINVPPPTWCPECRMIRRLVWRNDRFLYKRKSDFSGNEVFSMYPNESYARVYENNVWFSDKWDPMEYGQEIDFSRPFLNQLFDIIKKTPVPALSVLYGVNSDYSNNFTGYKNCYLVFCGDYSEDCMYGLGLSYTKNSLDNSYLYKTENCYEGFRITTSFNIFFSNHCSESFNLYFCKNCIGCNDCFGCVNLRNKKYHIFNQPYSKEEYFKKIKEWDLGSYKTVLDLKIKAYNFWLEFPVNYMHGINNKNVSGEYIYNSKNVLNSYIVSNSSDCRYCQYMEMNQINNCYDYSVWGNNSEWIYETVNSGINLKNVKFCAGCFPDVYNAEYSINCGSSSDIFGCVGIRRKKYCILNKEYSEKDFKNLRAKIIRHMNDMPYVDKKGRVYKYGEFFPLEFCPFPYNRSIIQDQFPLTDEGVSKLGCSWYDLKEKDYMYTISAFDLPDNIKNVNDSITKEIILCESWNKNPKKSTSS